MSNTVVGSNFLPDVALTYQEEVAVVGLREGCEGDCDVGVFGDVSAALHEDAQGGAGLVELGGWDHPADGVEVFVGEADAGGVHLKTEKNTANSSVADSGFRGV